MIPVHTGNIAAAHSREEKVHKGEVLGVLTEDNRC